MPFLLPNQQRQSTEGKKNQKKIHKLWEMQLNVFMPVLHK